MQWFLISIDDFNDDDDDDDAVVVVDDDGDVFVVVDDDDDNLVDQSHEVSVGPAGLVMVVGLLQHLRQLLASNIPVIHHLLSHIFHQQKKIEA